MNKVTRSRYLPASESEERKLSAESPDEILEEMQSRADTLDEVFKQQSTAAWALVERIKKNLAFGIPATIETVIQLQDAIQSLIQTQALTRLVRKELAEKYDEEMRALRGEG